MTLSAKPIDQEAYVWNKNYNGSLAQTRKTRLRVDKVYKNDRDIVAVFYEKSERDSGRYYCGRYYVQSFEESTLVESCSLLHVTNPNELEGKTLEAYITETELVGIRLQRQIPPEPQWGQGVL